MGAQLSTSAVMKRFHQLCVCALAVAAGASTQDVFEPADFNVTEALIDNGINVSTIPDLAGLAAGSSLKGCSIAVSLVHAISPIFR